MILQWLEEALPFFIRTSETVEPEIDVELLEKHFHNVVREYIIFGILFILLFVVSYATICAFRKKGDRDDYCSDDEDAIVYRTVTGLCTFTGASSAAAVLLIPLSVISNEVLRLYPNSYYVQWLNSSLIHGLWNHVFLFSNLALFILMPFAYFFTESEGLPGSKKGIRARVCETLLVLFLLGVLVCGIAWLMLAFIGSDQRSWDLLLDMWSIYIPFLYSCVSLFGVLLLLISTPVGFTCLFTVVGKLLAKPKFLRDIDEELSTTIFEVDSLKRQLKNKVKWPVVHRNNSHSTSENDECVADLQLRLEESEKDKRELEKRRKASFMQRNLLYPVVMLLLLALTVISVFMVAVHSIELLFERRALPIGANDILLGIDSTSAFGLFGAFLEVALILYIMCASVVGFYSLPLFSRIQPRLHDTSVTIIIANCIVILILSSALPVLSRTLGITNFDLLGDFGRMDWLGNFIIIFLYNMIFIAATTFCLVKKFTVKMRQELYYRLVNAFTTEKLRSSSFVNGVNGSALHNRED